jgi:hypothetical protein
MLPETRCGRKPPYERSSRMRHQLMMAGTLFAAMVAFAGCGSDSDALSLEEYFAEFEAIDAETDAAVEALFADFPDVSEDELISDDTYLPMFQEIAGSFPGIVGDAVEGMKALAPPSEVEDEHNELVAAGDQLTSAFSDANDELQDAETIADFMSIESRLDLELVAPASQRFDEACLELVAAGEDNGVTVNVDCLDEE